MNGGRELSDVGPGAVLYDERPADRRPCCRDGGRCLWHATSVYEDIENGDRLYELWDGTHTVREYVLGDDLLYDGMFTPAGWQFPTGLKPTYHLTRNCGVYDTHDVMLEANR